MKTGLPIRASRHKKYSKKRLCKKKRKEKCKSYTNFNFDLQTFRGVPKICRITTRLVPTMYLVNQKWDSFCHALLMWLVWPHRTTCAICGLTGNMHLKSWQEWQKYLHVNPRCHSHRKSGSAPQRCRRSVAQNMHVNSLQRHLIGQRWWWRSKMIIQKKCWHCCKA